MGSGEDHRGRPRTAARPRLHGLIDEITLRQATPADDELCYQLHRAAMRDHVAAARGWDEAEQRAYHRAHFDPRHTSIITVDDRAAGVLIVHRQPDEIELGRIELHPDHQGRGIGTHLIRQLLQEAGRLHQPVALEVMTVNPGARRLYQRLGFRETGRTDGKIHMRADQAQ